MVLMCGLKIDGALHGSISEKISRIIFSSFGKNEMCIVHPSVFVLSKA